MWEACFISLSYCLISSTSQWNVKHVKHYTMNGGIKVCCRECRSTKSSLPKAAKVRMWSITEQLYWRMAPATAIRHSSSQDLLYVTCFSLHKCFMRQTTQTRVPQHKKYGHYCSIKKWNANNDIMHIFQPWVLESSGLHQSRCWKNVRMPRLLLHYSES